MGDMSELKWFVRMVPGASTGIPSGRRQTVAVMHLIAHVQASRNALIVLVFQ